MRVDQRISLGCSRDVDGRPRHRRSARRVAGAERGHLHRCQARLAVRLEQNRLEGFVFVATNGGATWSKQFSFRTSLDVFYDLAFPDVSHGWVVGDSVAYATSDRGKSWVDFGVPGRTVAFADATHGCIAWDSTMSPDFQARAELATQQTGQPGMSGSTRQSTSGGRRGHGR